MLKLFIVSMAFFSSQLFSMVPGAPDRWNGSRYTQNAEIQMFMSLQTIGHCAKYLTKNNKLLDVGCGDGFITQHLASTYVNSVDGLDSSPSMIEYASKQQRDNLKFKLGSIETFQSLEEYDVVTAFNLLHYVDNTKTALNRIYNSLKPEGIFIATVKRVAPRDFYALALSEAMTACNIKRDDKLCVPGINRAEDWSLELKQMGFINTQVTVCDYTHTFNDKEAFVKWVQSGPHSINQINMVSSEQEEMYYQKVVEKYLEYIEYKGGSIQFKYPAFLIVAGKP